VNNTQSAIRKLQDAIQDLEEYLGVFDRLVPNPMELRSETQMAGELRSETEFYLKNEVLTSLKAALQLLENGS